MRNLPQAVVAKLIKTNGSQTEPAKIQNLIKTAALWSKEIGQLAAVRLF